MEEKKRKKAKKKNRSAQSDNVPEAAATTTCRDFEGVPSLAAVATAEETAPAFKEEEEEVVRPQEGMDPAEPASVFCLREEFQQVVRELRSASKSETENFRIFLEDLKTSHATSQANLELLIEQLRKEVFQLNHSTSLQKNKEVDLDEDIQRLREEVSQLRAMQEVQEERKTAKLAEIRQLREEIVKLSEGSVQQLRKVEEMSDTIQQLLLKREWSAASMGSYQLGQNLAVCASFSSEVGITSSPETSERLSTPTQGIVAEAGTTAGDSHFSMEAAATMVEELVAKKFDLVEKVNELRISMEHPTQQHSGVIQLPNNVVITNSSEAEKIVSLADYLVVEKNLDAQTKKVSTVDFLYSEEHAIETGSPDEHGPILDNNAFVNDFKHTGEEENEHYHAIPNMICSDLPQHALMQVDNDLKPFSDAPITGAPIRLFRFVARYVSGADLMKESSLTS